MLAVKKKRKVNKGLREEESLLPHNVMMLFKFGEGLNIENRKAAGFGQKTIWFCFVFCKALDC